MFSKNLFYEKDFVSFIYINNTCWGALMYSQRILIKPHLVREG